MSMSAAAIGGLAAMTASTITHPADQLKVRMFLHGEGRTAQTSGTRAMVGQIYRSEGVRQGFYRGVTATWLRQALFSTSRFGVNDAMKKAQQAGGGDIGVARKVLSAGVAGSVAACVSCPADLVLVRMQADGRLPKAEQRGYRNVFIGLHKIVSEEGVAQLYRGLRPLVLRGCFVTAGQFTTYDVAKRALMGKCGMADGTKTHLIASTMAGTVSTLIVNPLDVIKSRMMQSRARPAGVETSIQSYTSDWDCVRKTFKAEGVRGFYKGLAPCFMRQCPQVILMWVIFEQYKRAFEHMWGN
eukprot:TRINITY_DN205_c0_g2_i1.p1 TRINITY_DN205_c0_g2~~TRINITY_DN205_c0_g2_i1.p1  ORF type:complete len:329 (+),score=98.45 TRINITY_DN205_c0_g2_i1:92-988(+)